MIRISPAAWFALGNLNMAAVWVFTRWQRDTEQRRAYRRARRYR